MAMFVTPAIGWRALLFQKSIADTRSGNGAKTLSRKQDSRSRFNEA